MHIMAGCHRVVSLCIQEPAARCWNWKWPGKSTLHPTDSLEVLTPGQPVALLFPDLTKHAS